MFLMQLTRRQALPTLLPACCLLVVAVDITRPDSDFARTFCRGVPDGPLVQKEHHAADVRVGGRWWSDAETNSQRHEPHAPRYRRDHRRRNLRADGPGGRA